MQANLREIKVQGAVIDFDFMNIQNELYLLAGVNSFVHFYRTEVDEDCLFAVNKKLEA